MEQEQEKIIDTTPVKGFYADWNSREFFNKVAKNGFSTTAAVAMTLAVPGFIALTGGDITGMALAGAVGAGAATKAATGVIAVRFQEFGAHMNELT